MDSLRSLIRKGNTWTKFSATERSLFLQAWVLFPYVALSLKFRGMKETQTALSCRCATAPSILTDLQECQLRQTVRMVKLAARYSPLWSNCLKHSLVLWYLLRRQSIDSELRIGVRREGDKFQAHAWVEYAGQVLNDSPEVSQAYARFEQPIDLRQK
jgi:hypothetical protein